MENVVIVSAEDDDLEMLDASELNNSKAIHFKSSSFNNKCESKLRPGGLTKSKHTLDATAAAISSNETLHLDNELESKSGSSGLTKLNSNGGKSGSSGLTKLNSIGGKSGSSGLTKLNSIGNFQDSCLLSYLEGSWNNAQKIIKLTLNKVYRATTVENHQPRQWSIIRHDSGVSSATTVGYHEPRWWILSQTSVRKSQF